MFVVHDRTLSQCRLHHGESLVSMSPRCASFDLLEHGAEETEEDRERWRICEKAWLCENIRLREARDLDSHDYDPCGAAIERDM